MRPPFGAAAKAMGIDKLRVIRVPEWTPRRHENANSGRRQQHTLALACRPSPTGYNVQTNARLQDAGIEVPSPARVGTGVKALHVLSGRPHDPLFRSGDFGA